MDRNQQVNVINARQEVADIFAATLLDMILDASNRSDEDCSSYPKAKAVSFGERTESETGSEKK